MSATLAAWHRHPSHGNLSLPTDPTERDAYIMKVAASWRRAGETALIEAIADWQGATTRSDRAACRAGVRGAATRYRHALSLYHDVWTAFCADRGAMQEAA